MIQPLIILLSLPLVTQAQSKTYTDSRGEIFTLDHGKKANIVINSVGAISLFHLGLASEQLVGIYDSWVVRGSNLDLDNPANNYESIFDIDPNKEEIDFLKSAGTNLSPTCSNNSNGCLFGVDEEKLKTLEYDFIIVQRATNPTFFNDFEDKTVGHKILWVDDFHEDGCQFDDDFTKVASQEPCNSASLIDIVQRLEKLAEFLGLHPTDAIIAEQNAMCASASKFIDHSEALHQAGIGVGASTLRPENGGTLYFANPIHFTYLRTMEELGFPLIHPGIPGDVLVKKINAADWFLDNKGKTLYAVDFWLWDSRAYGTVLVDPDTYSDVALQFPDKAMTSKQYSPWFFNDGAISYTNIRRMLDELREASTGIDRLHKNRTVECVDVDVTVYGSIHEESGLPTHGGKVACFDRNNLQSLYTECGPLTWGEQYVDDGDGASKVGGTGGESDVDAGGGESNTGNSGGEVNADDADEKSESKDSLAAGTSEQESIAKNPIMMGVAIRTLAATFLVHLCF